MHCISGRKPARSDFHNCQNRLLWLDVQEKGLHWNDIAQQWDFVAEGLRGRLEHSWEARTLINSNVNAAAMLIKENRYALGQQHLQENLAHIRHNKYLCRGGGGDLGRVAKTLAGLQLIANAPKGDMQNYWALLETEFADAGMYARKMGWHIPEQAWEGVCIMGTSSSGRSGSGSGRRAGGGGAGSYVSSGGKMSSKSYEQNDVRNEVRKLLKQLFGRAAPYTREMFDNPYLKNIYTELFSFSALIRDQDSAGDIGQRYNLDMDEPGFILSLIEKLDEKYRQTEVDSRCVNAVQQTLADFLFRAVKDDPDLSIDGAGSEVIAAMGEYVDFWKSLSGHFLSNLANNMYEMDVERKSRGATLAVKEEFERRTNQVIASYEQLSGEGRTNYQQLFEHIGQNWDWFKKEMTR